MCFVATVVTVVVTAVVTIGCCVVTVATGRIDFVKHTHLAGHYGHYTKTNGHYSGHYSGHYGRYKEHSRLQGHSQQHLHMTPSANLCELGPQTHTRTHCGHSTLYDVPV